MTEVIEQEETTTEQPTTTTTPEQRLALVEAQAKLLARGIRQDMLNAWWSDLELEAQQTLYDSGN